MSKLPTNKNEHQRQAGFFLRMPIPKWKWERIAMDFLVGLPKTLGKFDSIWVVVDRLTKSAHFISVRNIMLNNWLKFM